MQVHELGADAVLVDVDGTEAALSLAAHVRDHPGPALAVEVVPGAATVLFDGVADREELSRRLRSWTPGPVPAPGAVVELATTYDGADLAAVAEAWGTDTAGVVARHQDTAFVVAFCGFSPGFAYLSGLPARLAVPRLDTPRTRVPAGSVGLAGEWCGVYPSASPGGWQLLGRTDAALWDVARDDPALLSPGTRVRFVAT